MVSKDFCDLCNTEMGNYFHFSYDFNPTISNEHIDVDDEGEIDICYTCKEKIKFLLFQALGWKITKPKT